MKFTRPTTITDAILSSTTVSEADYTEFAMATVYDVGERCMVATGLEILILNVAPASDWVAGDIITGQSSAKTCVCVSKITALTYYVRERTGAFTLGEVIGVTGTAAKLADQGAAYPTITAPTDNVHKVYESLSAGNTKNYPPLDVLETIPKWVEVSSTNRWKVFDGKVGTQTEQAASMAYTLVPGRIDSIALLNMDATGVSIVMTDPVDGEVYNKTIDLVSTSNVYDGYTYCFEPIIRKTDVVLLDLPPYAAASIDITITNTDDIARCGAIIVGLQRYIGETLFGMALGITSYSTKQADSFGNYSITRRSNSKLFSTDVRIPNDQIDEVYRLLSLYESELLVWVGVGIYTSMIVYGFYKDFSIVMPGPRHSDCAIEIEGLT